MKILLVDDEPLARQRLKRMLDAHPHCSLVGEAGDGEQAIRQCQALAPDLVLMDIRMPGIDGLQAARHLALLEQPPAVVFCTAYDDYALEAFEASAVDYLLKPVQADKLATALERAGRLNRVQLAGITGVARETGGRSHISARSHRGVELVPVTEVRCFIADQKYVTALHPDGELLLDESLKELENEFPDRFARVHRNALVALAHVQGLERLDGGHVRVRLSGLEEGPLVSRRMLPALRRLLSDL